MENILKEIKALKKEMTDKQEEHFKKQEESSKAMTEEFKKLKTEVKEEYAQMKKDITHLYGEVKELKSSKEKNEEVQSQILKKIKGLEKQNEKLELEQEKTLQRQMDYQLRFRNIIEEKNEDIRKIMCELLAKSLSSELVDKSIIHAVETAVIEWTHQIQSVLKRESSDLLLKGQDPNPKVELDFWKNRYEDLQCIYDQLKAKRISAMVELLDRVQSTYYAAFTSVLRDVEAALVEAQDINVHLKPIQGPLEEIENVEFNEVKPLLNRVLHTVCLIWATSKYYSTPARTIVLLQEICSLLIQQARNYLNYEDLLKAETEESLRKVEKAFDVFNYFKQLFEERRETLNSYFHPGQVVKKWDFPSVMVFAQLDNFLERLQVVHVSIKL
ncbi:dynein axonemal heavy chain 9-like [Anolis sagrei]|uniref:dynein axonemal heavy chain 9-like n=1 Tax=Anolis sagrei TaxID=38937 RepID=UPI003522B61E